MGRETVDVFLCDRSQELVIRLNSKGVVEELHCLGKDDEPLQDVSSYVGERIEKILEPELARRLLEAVEESLQSSKLIFFEYSSVGLYGQSIHEVRVIPSGADAATVILRNVREDRNTKFMLMESENRYRHLFEHSLQGIVLLQDFRIVYTNEAMARITGFSIGELKGFSPEELTATVHPDDRDMVWGRFRDRLNNKPVPPNYECRFIKKDGTVRWVEIFSKTCSMW